MSQDRENLTCGVHSSGLHFEIWLRLPYEGTYMTYWHIILSILPEMRPLRYDEGWDEAEGGLRGREEMCIQ
jgi:hypothetical protein